jgi:hypothetical protein
MAANAPRNRKAIHSIVAAPGTGAGRPGQSRSLPYPAALPGRRRRRGGPDLRRGLAWILKAWGRLEEAMALHKKREAFCLELGNKSSLAHCYWTWGLLAREQHDSNTERKKLTAALDIFTALNMPRERDVVLAELEKTTIRS